MRKGDFLSSIASSPPEPAYDYNPYDNASSGLDNAGFSFPPQTDAAEQPIMGEGLPPAGAEAPTKPERKPRARKVVAEPETEAPPAPARKPRTKKPAAAKDTAG